MLPLLYVVRMDVESDYLDEFVKWYDTRHGPDLINAGFFSCNAYHSIVGEPFICNVYEVPDIAIFSSEAYAAVRKEDEQLTNEVLAKISNHSNTTYSQSIVLGPAPTQRVTEENRPSRGMAVTAPVIATTCFNFGHPDEEKLIDWITAYFEAHCVRGSELISARLAKQHGKHPLFPSSQPDWILLTEWANSQSAIDSSADLPFTFPINEMIEDHILDSKSNVACLSATLLNSASWSA